MTLGTRNGFDLSLIKGSVAAGDQVQFSESERSRVWLINPSRLDITAEQVERIDNVSHHPWELPNPWSALIQDTATGQFRVTSSPGSEFGWLYDPTTPGVVSTSLSEMVKATGRRSPDPVTVCTLIGAGWTVGRSTLVDGVVKLPGGHLLSIDNSRFVDRPIDLTGWLGLDASLDNIEEMVDRFLALTAAGLHDERSQVTLTSGKDSRAVLAAALASGRPFVIETGKAPKTTRSDIEVPQRIAKLLGVEHLLVDVGDVPIPHRGPDGGPDLEPVYRSFMMDSNGEVDPLNAVMHYKEYVLAADRPSKLTGWGGEIHFHLPSYYMSIIDLKLKASEPAVADEAKARVAAMYRRSTEISPELAVDVFHLLDKTANAGAAHWRAALPYFPIYAPFSDPTLIGLGFRLRGGPTSSGLHQAMFARLPPSVQDIPVNRGGGLGAILFKARRRFLPSIDRSHLADPALVRRCIDPTRFAEVVSESAVVEMIDSYEQGSVRSAGPLHKLLGLNILFDSFES